MDILTKAKRSWNMSRIRSKDTKPEIMVRSWLHRHGYRFRLHVKDLPGKPDIVLPKYGSIIFVNGCFWHRHQGCKYAYKPKTRVKFWDEKFRQNIKRQKDVQIQLKGLGWRTIVIWECEVNNESKIKSLSNFIRSLV